MSQRVSSRRAVEPSSVEPSSRHEGDLGGRLLPFGDIEQLGVTIEIPVETAGLASTQHTA